MPRERLRLVIEAQDRASAVVDSLQEKLSELDEQVGLEIDLDVRGAIADFDRLAQEASTLDRLVRDFRVFLDTGQAESALDDLSGRLESGMSASVDLDTSQARRQIDDLSRRLDRATQPRTIRLSTSGGGGTSAVESAVSLLPGVAAAAPASTGRTLPTAVPTGLQFAQATPQLPPSISSQAAVVQSAGVSVAPALRERDIDLGRLSRLSTSTFGFSRDVFSTLATIQSIIENNPLAGAGGDPLEEYLSGLSREELEEIEVLESVGPVAAAIAAAKAFAASPAGQAVIGSITTFAAQRAAPRIASGARRGISFVTRGRFGGPRAVPRASQAGQAAQTGAEASAVAQATRASAEQAARQAAASRGLSEAQQNAAGLAAGVSVDAAIAAGRSFLGGGARSIQRAAVDDALAALGQGPRAAAQAGARAAAEQAAANRGVGATGQLLAGTAGRLAADVGVNAAQAAGRATSRALTGRLLDFAERTAARSPFLRRQLERPTISAAQQQAENFLRRQGALSSNFPNIQGIGPLAQGPFPPPPLTTFQGLLQSVRQNPVLAGTTALGAGAVGFSVLDAVGGQDEVSSLGTADVSTQERNFQNAVRAAGIDPSTANRIVDEIDNELNAGRAVALRFATIAIRSRSAELIANAPEVFRFLRSRLRITGIEEAGPDAILDRLTQATFEEGGLLNLSNLGIPEDVIDPRGVEAQARAQLGLRPGTPFPETAEGLAAVRRVQAGALTRLATSTFGRESIQAAEPGLREQVDRIRDFSRELGETAIAELDAVFARQDTPIERAGRLTAEAVIGPEGAAFLRGEDLGARIGADIDFARRRAEQFPLFEERFGAQADRFAQLRQRLAPTFGQLTDAQIADLFERRPELRAEAFGFFEDELADQQREAQRQQRRTGRRQPAVRTDPFRRRQQQIRTLQGGPGLATLGLIQPRFGGFGVFTDDVGFIRPEFEGFGGPLDVQGNLVDRFDPDRASLLPRRRPGFAEGFSRAAGQQLLSPFPGFDTFGQLFSGAGLGAVAGGLVGGVGASFVQEGLDRVVDGLFDGGTKLLKGIFDQGEEDPGPVGDAIPGLSASSPAVPPGLSPSIPGSEFDAFFSDPEGYLAQFGAGRINPQQAQREALFADPDAFLGIPPPPSPPAVGDPGLGPPDGQAPTGRSGDGSVRIEISLADDLRADITNETRQDILIASGNGEQVISSRGIRNE